MIDVLTVNTPNPDVGLTVSTCVQCPTMTRV